MPTEVKISKFIDLREFVDKPDEHMNVIEIRDNNQDFNKTWYEYIIYALDITGSQAKKFIFWLFGQAENGQILMTFKQMANNSNISLFTVTKVMGKLIGAGLITKRNMGAYQLAPGISEDLSDVSNFNILLKFQKQPRG